MLRKFKSGMLATDLADYLVRKVPFRQAHSTVGKLDNTAGKLVQYAINKSKGFEELNLDECHWWHCSGAGGSSFGAGQKAYWSGENEKQAD